MPLLPLLTAQKLDDLKRGLEAKRKEIKAAFREKDRLAQKARKPQKGRKGQKAQPAQQSKRSRGKRKQSKDVPKASGCVAKRSRNSDNVTTCEACHRQHYPIKKCREVYQHTAPDWNSVARAKVAKVAKSANSAKGRRGQRRALRARWAARRKGSSKGTR